MLGGAAVSACSFRYGCPVVIRNKHRRSVMDVMGVEACISVTPGAIWAAAAAVAGLLVTGGQDDAILFHHAAE